MSCFSEPMPINDDCNHHGDPNVGIRCLVCPTESRGFFPLLLPNSSITPLTFSIQEFVWTQLFGYSLVRI